MIQSDCFGNGLSEKCLKYLKRNKKQIEVDRAIDRTIKYLRTSQLKRKVKSSEGLMIFFKNNFFSIKVGIVKVSEDVECFA